MYFIAFDSNKPTLITVWYMAKFCICTEGIDRVHTVETLNNDQTRREVFRG